LAAPPARPAPVVLKAAAESPARPGPVVLKAADQPAAPVVLKAADEPPAAEAAAKPPSPGPARREPLRFHARVQFDPGRWSPGDLRAEIDDDGLILVLASGERRRVRPGSGSTYRGRNFLTADLGDREIEISMEALSLNTYKLAQDLSAFLDGQRGPLDPAGYAISFDDKVWREIVPRLAGIRPPAGFVVAFVVVPPLWVLYWLATLCLRPFGVRRWPTRARIVATLLVCCAFLASCPCGVLSIGVMVNYGAAWQHWPTITLGDGAATVQMPATVSTRTSKLDTGEKVNVIECNTSGLTTVNYAAAVVELPKGQEGRTADAAFELASPLRVELFDKLCGIQMRRTPPRLTKKITLEGGYPGLERRFETGGFDSQSRHFEGQLAERCYLVKDRVYVLVVFRDRPAPRDPAEFDRFLNSLKVKAEK
jgi:hypothetical protein